MTRIDEGDKHVEMSNLFIPEVSNCSAWAVTTEQSPADWKQALRDEHIAFFLLQNNHRLELTPNVRANFLGFPQC